MKKQHNHFRHGDVLLSRIRVLPDGLEEQKHRGECILASGEVTGHHHRLTVKNPANMRVFQKEQKIYVMLMEVGTLTHEEHKEVRVPIGTYERTFEREFDYALDSLRTVID